MIKQNRRHHSVKVHRKQNFRNKSLVNKVECTREDG